MDLENELHRLLITNYNRAGREAGYWGNRFLREVRTKGGLATVKRMLKPSSRPGVAPGLRALMDVGRTDLSIEAVATDPRFSSLFTEEETAEARRRLDSLSPESSPHESDLAPGSSFQFGQYYTRNQIHARLGGSTISFLPTVAGKVVCACLKPDLNPGAPGIILVGRGRDIERAGEILSTQAAPVPVFIKRASNRWSYCGLWRARRSSTSPGKARSESEAAGRDDVTRVIHMARPRQPADMARNVWIFQAVPAQYDLLEEVPKRITTGDWWRVTRFRHDMRTGDLLLFWKSGHDAGIYATGEIIGDKPYRVRDQWRIDVKYTGLLKTPILKPTLASHPLLKHLSILRQPQGTNFRVKPQQWRALKPAVTDAPGRIPLKVMHAVTESGTFDPKNTKDARERTQASIFVRQGQPQFRQKLLRLHAGKCIITGCDAEQALEAAHICPYKGKHTNNPRNGLLLRADLHTLFDLGLIAVDTSTMTLLLAPELKHTSYSDLQGRALRIPPTCPLPPSREALDKHREQAEL